jgi:hypothetical protein
MDNGSVDGHEVRCTYTPRYNVDVGSCNRPQDVLVPYNRDIVASCHTPPCRGCPSDTTGIAPRVIEDVRAPGHESIGALP